MVWFGGSETPSSTKPAPVFPWTLSTNMLPHHGNMHVHIQDRKKMEGQYLNQSHLS